ncbi:MAG: MFS transporter [Jatrophihabitantaceae bacterium]
MSNPTTDRDGPAAPEQVGVLATWREMPRPAKALLAGVFVSKLAGFIQIFLVLFLTARGFSSGQAGFGLGMYGAGAILGTFVGGSLSDRQSARTAMLTSMLGSAALLVSIVYLKNYYLLLLAIVLVSAVSQVYRPAAQAMITELTPGTRLVMVTAIYRLCLNLGTSAAPLLGVALVSVSYNLLFWGEALAAVIYCLIALFFLPRGRPKPSPAANHGDAAVEPPRKPRSGYLEMFGDHRYMLFLLGFLFLHLVYIQYTAVLPLAVTDAGLSTWWYAAAITINGALIVACEVWATKFVQHWSLRLSQGAGYALLAAGYAAYSIGMTPALLVIGTLLWTLSEIVGAPTVWAYPGLVAPSHLRGRYYGGLHSTYGLGSTIGPIIGIALFASVGQRFFLYATAVGVLATIVGQLGIRTPETEPAAEPAVAEALADAP